MRPAIVPLVIVLATVSLTAAAAQATETLSDRQAVPILIYHSIRPYRTGDLPGVRKFITTPEALEEEFAYLKENDYTTISFDDLERSLRAGTALPPKPVIISFDDGPETQYTYALPLLRKFSFTATFFLFSNAIGREHYMSWDQVIELSAEGMQIGCHTRFHPYLTRITDEKQLRDEVAGAKERLESHLGKPVTAFAYPFGQYNEHVVQAVKKAGYTCARGTYPGISHGFDQMFTLTGLIRTANLESLVTSLQAACRETPRQPRAAGG